jgi:predicted NAD/FAD-dependent oxidoreductase
VIGAGMAGIACARTLAQAGCDVTVLEKSRGAGGRMSTRETPFGSFDHGAQYFTVRDERFARALETVPGLCRPWSATAVRVLDAHGRVAEAALPTRDSHWVPAPGMNALVRAWAEPLASAGRLLIQTQVTRVEPDALDARRWQLRSEGPEGTQQVHSGFDAVVLALPGPQAQMLLQASSLAPDWRARIEETRVAPCWTLMLAYPNASQPGLAHLGPQWNAALSTHHRVAWLARESSKPRRGAIERWTVQASADWSAEHLEDDPGRVAAKLQKAFAEITGIVVQPGHVDVHRWRYAKTTTPLGQSYLWDGKRRLGVCGDWCLGHRVENAFVSGLELALKMA